MRRSKLDLIMVRMSCRNETVSQKEIRRTGSSLALRISAQSLDMVCKSTACLVFEYRVRNTELHMSVREQYVGSTDSDK